MMELKVVQIIPFVSLDDGAKLKPEIGNFEREEWMSDVRRLSGEKKEERN